MSRQPMQRRGEVPAEPAPDVYVTRNSRDEFVAHVSDGPRFLLARGDHETARRDGLAYVLRNYRFDPTVGRWRPRGDSADVQEWG